MLPDFNTAVTKIASQVELDAYFRVLASRGYSPEAGSQEETMKRASMLEDFRWKLRQMENTPEVKAAAAANDPMLNALHALSQTCTAAIPSQVKAARDNAIAQHALSLMQNPDIYMSGLSIIAHEKAAAAQR